MIAEARERLDEQMVALPFDVRADAEDDEVISPAWGPWLRELHFARLNDAIREIPRVVAAKSAVVELLDRAAAREVAIRSCKVLLQNAPGALAVQPEFRVPPRSIHEDMGDWDIEGAPGKRRLNDDGVWLELFNYASERWLHRESEPGPDRCGHSRNHAESDLWNVREADPRSVNGEPLKLIELGMASPTRDCV